MMNENERILIAKSILRITFILTWISLFLKFAGIDIVSLETENLVNFHLLNKIFNNVLVQISYGFLLIYIQQYILFRLSCKNKNMKIYKYSTLIYTCLTLIFQYTTYKYNLLSNTNGIFYFLYTYTLSIITVLYIDRNITNRKNKGNKIITSIYKCKKMFFWATMFSFYQIIVIIIKSATYNDIYDTLYNALLNFDYIILLLITYYLYIKKGTKVRINSSFEFFLTNLLNEVNNYETYKEKLYDLSNYIKELKNKPKVERNLRISYWFINISCEIINIMIIFTIAQKNNAIIECIFITFAFANSKNVFGTFNFDAAWKSYFTANLTFFIFNKIDFGVNNSILIPIFLGIIFSYMTSISLKKSLLKPYRGMNEDELKLIFKNCKLSIFEKNILEDFYCNRKTITYLTHKYNYSQTAIVRFKRNALSKIE